MECQGSGGCIFTHDGYGYAGSFDVEDPCERCGGFHPSPSDREDERRYQEWLANPGIVRRAWRRLRGRS